jgi:hypothetical protein
MLGWVIAAIALAVAAGAWIRAGRIARKLDALNQSYWELRYDFTRLRSQGSQAARLDPGADQPSEAAPAPPAGQMAFVPLSSMRKKA